VPQPRVNHGRGLAQRDGRAPLAVARPRHRGRRDDRAVSLALRFGAAQGSAGERVPPHAHRRVGATHRQPPGARPASAPAAAQPLAAAPHDRRVAARTSRSRTSARIPTCWLRWTRRPRCRATGSTNWSKLIAATTTAPPRPTRSSGPCDATASARNAPSRLTRCAVACAPDASCCESHKPNGTLILSATGPTTLPV
jgi:hypothetical protein